MSRWILMVSWLLAVPLTAQETGDKLARQLDRLSRWLNSPRESIREEAVSELATLPMNHALPLLLSAVTDTSAVVRAAAANALVRANDNRIIPALRPLLVDSNDQVRAAAVWALSHTGGRAVLPAILPLCREDPSGVVRFRAVWGLAIIGDKSALPVAIAALGDYIPAVRERAAPLAVETLADASVGERLARQAQNEYAPTRRIVMYLLGRQAEPDQATAVLRQGLKDGDPLVRAEAALALGRRRATIALSDLRAVLKDPDEHVRGAAVYAIGLIGDARQREAVRPLLDDDQAFVRAIAAETLHRLGDRTVKPRPGFRAEDLFTYPIYSPAGTPRLR